MMKLLTSAAGALALVTAPVVQAAPSRASAPMTGESQLAGNNEGGGLVLAIVGAIGIIWALIEVTDDDPESP